MSKKQLIAAVAAMAFASIAAAGESSGAESAYAGVAADAVTTGAALAMPGFVETNPLGWATVPIRLAIIQYAKEQPREKGQPIMDGVEASGWAAAASNLLMLAGAGAAAPVVGLAVGYGVWKKGETQREFWNLCAVHKNMEAGTKCEYRAWSNDEVYAMAQAQYEQRMAAKANGLVKVSAAASTEKPVLAAVTTGL